LGDGIWQRESVWSVEFFDDVTVGKAVIEQAVDLVAEGLGQAGDFADASAAGEVRASFRVIAGGGFWRR
jgi:hypothetical protein